MLCHCEVSGSSDNDASIPAMTASLLDLDESLPFESPVDLPGRQYSHR